MEIGTFCTMIVGGGAFYYQIIRPRRYVAFLTRLLCFFIIIIPGVAFLTRPHSQPETRPITYAQHTAYEAEVDASVFAFITAMFFSMFVCVFVDIQTTWKDLLCQILYSFAMVQGMLLYIFWNTNRPMTRQHIAFLLIKGPATVSHYITTTLPSYSLDDIWWLVKEVAYAMIHSTSESPQSEFKGNVTANFTIIREL